MPLGRSSVLRRKQRSVREILALGIQASGTSDRCPGGRTLERDVLHDHRIALIHSAPNRVPERSALGKLLAWSWGSTRSRSDVGQVVKDILGRPRDVNGVLDGHTLAHFASAPPARGPGWTSAQRNEPHTLSEAAGDRPCRLPRLKASAGSLGQGLFGHPLLHHRALKQLLPHEGIGGDDALRSLDRIGLERDQAA
jgi:hypothetical protein